MPEYFTYKCPHCAAVRNAAHVAAELDHGVVAAAALVPYAAAEIAGRWDPTVPLRLP